MQKTPFQTPMALHCICFLLVLIDTYSLYSMISHLLWLLKLQHKPFLINSLFLTKHDRHLIKQNTQKDCVDLSIIAFKLQEISNTLQETKHITIVMTVMQRHYSGYVFGQDLQQIWIKHERYCVYVHLCRVKLTNQIQLESSVFKAMIMVLSLIKTLKFKKYYLRLLIWWREFNMKSQWKQCPSNPSNTDNQKKSSKNAYYIQEVSSSVN